VAHVTKIAIRELGTNQIRKDYEEVEVTITLSLHTDAAGGVVSLLDGALDILWQQLDNPVASGAECP